MTWKKVNHKGRWSRTATNQLNLQLTDKPKRLHESSDQPNKNYHIQSLTFPCNFLIWVWLLCSYSSWTKSNDLDLNSFRHMLQMTYLGFCTKQLSSFWSKLTSNGYIRVLKPNSSFPNSFLFFDLNISFPFFLKGISNVPTYYLN